MPPFLPRRRLASTPPPAGPRNTPAKKAKLADALDGWPTRSPAPSKCFTLGEDSDSDDSMQSDDFEDMPPKPAKSKPQQDEDDENEDEDEDVDWEDATKDNAEVAPAHVPMAGGDIQLTFRKDDDGPDYAQQAAASGKKGPSKKERATRILTHMMHVQCLLFHNAIRNSWICDKKVQDTLVEQLPTQIKEEVRKWKVKSGMIEPESKHTKSSKSKKGKKRTNKDDRAERDWGKPSERLEAGKPDLSGGDPLVHLMKVLCGYWRKRFAIAAPGLRKRGYGTKLQLKNTIASYRNEEHDPDQHGERIANLEEFRKLVRGNGKNIFGSRDLGAQLFTALCRGLDIDARMVASLQPSGFGWSKAEQIKAKSSEKSEADNDSDDSDDEDEDESSPPPKKVNKIKEEANSKLKNSAKTPVKTAKASSAKESTKKAANPPSKIPVRKAKGKGDKSAPINLESDKDEDEETEMKAEDSDLVVDITPSMPKQQPHMFDKDLPFPVYWTEVVSPINHKILPVSSLVIDKDHCVATTAGDLVHFEPRGAKADKAKTVMAYVVAYSDDGTAKDVTTRYLKCKTWPGKTKGLRYPIEKVPVYNKKGKIIRYEVYDWFEDTMRGYKRSDDKLTEVDRVEDKEDLVPQQPQKKKREDEGDTLSSLKSSAEWVIKRHLRREEALLPHAKPDRVFISGKPKTASYKEENVYRRADVAKCQTAETWHKYGRIPMVGETPMKHVPVRAVTLTRKREVEDHLKQTGRKLTQGLYSEAQTEYIIPPPIEDGKIPKNAYNNIDCFVPSMVPEGAVHLALKGLKRICNKLEIDFAEAVVGFEFGNRMAVPIINGVVIAKENEDVVREAHASWAEEQRIKEEGKIEKQALDMWRKMLMGLRIRERVADEYGAFEVEGDAVPNARKVTKEGKTADEPIDVDVDDVMEGGGFGPDEDEEMDGGFLMPHEDEEEDTELVMEHHEPFARGKGKEKEEAMHPTSASMPSTTKGKGKPRKSMLQYDGADDPEDEESSELSEVSEKEDEDKSDDFRDSKSKKRVSREHAVTPKRTRRSLLGQGETSPYF